MWIPFGPPPGRLAAWLASLHDRGYNREVWGFLAAAAGRQSHLIRFPPARRALSTLGLAAHFALAPEKLSRAIVLFERDWAADPIDDTSLGIWHAMHADGGNWHQSLCRLALAASGGGPGHPFSPFTPLPPQPAPEDPSTVGATAAAMDALKSLSADAFGWAAYELRGPCRWLPGPAGPADVYRVANDIFARQAWDELGVLADALEEAHAENAALSQHFRSTFRHGRCCWALRLIRCYPPGTWTGQTTGTRRPGV